LKKIKRARAPELLVDQLLGLQVELDDSVSVEVDETDSDGDAPVDAGEAVHEA
jgi:hypothetical protein